jgi:membrane-associated protease RseP (regulator of RpoE activity)
MPAEAVVRLSFSCLEPGLRPGDTLSSINGKPVKSVDELRMLTSKGGKLWRC